MISISDDYKIDADKYQYILLHRTIGKDKDGNKKEHWDKTFHPTIQQVCNAIMNDELRAAIQIGMVDELDRMAKELCSAVELIKGDSDE